MLQSRGLFDPSGWLTASCRNFFAPSRASVGPPFLLCLLPLSPPCVLTLLTPAGNLDMPASAIYAPLRRFLGRMLGVCMREPCHTWLQFSTPGGSCQPCPAHVIDYGNGFKLFTLVNNIVLNLPIVPFPITDATYVRRFWLFRRSRLPTLVKPSKR